MGGLVVLPKGSPTSPVFRGSHHSHRHHDTPHAPHDEYSGRALQALPTAASMAADMARQKAELGAKHALINQMLERGNQGRKVPPEQLARVRDALAILPIEQLQTVARDNARIAILQEGETPRDLGVIKPLNVRERYKDPAADRAVIDGAFAAADKQHARAVADARKRLDVALKATADRPKPRPGRLAVFNPEGPDHPEVAAARKTLRDAEAARDEAAWKSITEKTGGRYGPVGLDTPDLPPMGPASISVATTLLGSPATLEQIAQRHGARTPAEVKQFTDLMTQINGDRLQAATDRFVETVPPERRAMVRQKLAELPASKRLLSQRGDLVVPNLFYDRKTDDPKAPSTPIDVHDRNSIFSWQMGHTRGQYWFQEDRRTVVLDAKNLAPGDRNTHTIVHEFGHAFEWAIERKDPVFYKDWSARWQAHHQKSQGTPERFPSEYAQSSPHEHLAEAFAHHHGRRDVEKLDPVAFRLYQELLERARR